MFGATPRLFWNSSKPEFYRLVIEMKGDRVERAQFEVSVRSGQMDGLRRDGTPAGFFIRLVSASSYSNTNPSWLANRSTVFNCPAVSAPTVRMNRNDSLILSTIRVYFRCRSLSRT